MNSPGYHPNNPNNPQISSSSHIRNKSIDKPPHSPPLLKNPSTSNLSFSSPLLPNTLTSTTKPPQRFTYNVLSQQTKPVPQLCHLKHPHQFHCEGDLNNLDKIKPYQPNIRTIPKNATKNQLKPFMKNLPLHNSNSSNNMLPSFAKDTNIKRNKLPRKSPLQYNHSYLIQSGHGLLPFAVNNFIYNNYLKVNNTNTHAIYSNNSKGHVVKTKSDALHMYGDSNSNNSKQRIMSKSPTLNVSALFERFKKYKIVDYANNFHNNSNSNASCGNVRVSAHFTNKTNNGNGRPKSSNVVYSNGNSNGNGNEMHLHTHNINTIKQHTNTSEHNNSFHISNNTNMTNNNTETKQQQSQSSSYKSKTEKSENGVANNGVHIKEKIYNRINNITNSTNNNNNNNSNISNSNSNISINNKINIDATPTVSSIGSNHNATTSYNNNTTSSKHIARSHSQNTPNIIQDIINSSTTNPPNTHSATSPIPLLSKKIRNIYQFTHVGFDGEADKTNNQDIAFIEQNFAGNSKYFYMSVCDGHGVDGHSVSGFIKKILPKKMTRLLKGKDLQSNEPSAKAEIHKLIVKGFRNSNNDLIRNVNVNSTFSGSTCVSVIFTPSKLISANIGDSRAVIGRYENTKWTSFDLTRDHKPTEMDEAERILNASGRIQPFVDEDTGEFVGPQRVWLKEDDVPGLAMTRSFGDRVAATVGVNSEPEILEYELGERDKFVLIASDGIWEFISSKEAVEIIKEYYARNDMKGCCEYLYSESRKRWLHEEDVVDDITMVLVFYDK